MHTTRSHVPQATKDLAKAHFFAGLNQEDIATKCGVSSNTIRSWISRGKWKDEKKGMAMRVSAKVESKMLPCIENQASEAILAHHEHVKRIVKRQMDKLERSEAQKSADLQSESIALKNVVEIARVNLGLGADGLAQPTPSSFHLHLSGGKVARRSEAIEISSSVSDDSEPLPEA